MHFYIILWIQQRVGITAHAKLLTMVSCRKRRAEILGWIGLCMLSSCIFWFYWGLPRAFEQTDLAHCWDLGPPPWGRWSWCLASNPSSLWWSGSCLWCWKCARPHSLPEGNQIAWADNSMSLNTCSFFDCPFFVTADGKISVTSFMWLSCTENNDAAADGGLNFVYC